MSMSICPQPQVRIYEDFDKMSAKEVYYNESGKKVTVKLLNFPDVPPEEVHRIQFKDEDDNQEEDVINGNKSKGVQDDIMDEEDDDDDDDEEDDDEEEEEEDDDDDYEDESNTAEAEGKEEDDDGDGDVNNEKKAKEAHKVRSQHIAHGSKKKPMRKKSSGNLLHARKCSIAFAQAHGIQIESTSTGSISTPKQSLTPTIMIPPKSFNSTEDDSSFVALRRQLQLGRRSPSPHGSNSLCPGYVQYSKSFLEVPLPRDYGYASSDDLSSEWDSDVSSTAAYYGHTQVKKPSGWRKIRNIVQWTPFFQTYKKQRYPWVQLAGHQGNFKAGPEQGTVLKKLCPKEENCFQVLMKDVLRPYVPEYKGQVTSEDGELYLQLQDLLSDFYQPCVMDCKIGVRTYLEEELSKAKEKPKLRKDMYEKMIQIDPHAPSEEEHKAKGVTKPRYMVWRETISSTATLGFRIEGIKKSDGTSSKDFKTTKSREQIKQAFREFITGFPHALPRYIQRLRAIRATLECSDFFRSHEVIGSSLLFVHDRHQASVWLIDFAKTVMLPNNHQIDHSTTWTVGNHEDGYLIGINNLIEIFNELEVELASAGASSASEASLSGSSDSSSASMSPKRSESESNADELLGAVGGVSSTTLRATETSRRNEPSLSEKEKQLEGVHEDICHEHNIKETFQVEEKEKEAQNKP